MKIRHELNAALFDQKTNDYQRMPYHAEEYEFEAVAKGNAEKVRRQLETGEIDFINSKRTLSNNPLQNMKLHFAVSAAAIANACIKEKMGHDEAYTIADIYCRKADKCRSPSAVRLTFEELCTDCAERMSEIRKNDVISLHVRKCIDRIYEDLHADLTIEALAETAGLNPTYLARLFKQETGLTVKEYVTSAKMDTAKNLLKYSDLPYADIAVCLGYSSQSAFIYAFRRFTGTTPGRYRKLYYVVRTGD